MSIRHKKILSAVRFQELEYKNKMIILAECKGRRKHKKHHCVVQIYLFFIQEEFFLIPLAFQEFR